MGQTEPSDPPAKVVFNRLPEEARERLVVAIEQTPPELFVRPFAAAVAQRADQNEKWVESLCFFLADWFAFLSEDPNGYLERVVAFLAEASDDADRSSGAAETLRGQWRRIMLSGGSIGVTLKAFDILRRQANAYKVARTTTEIRPVYLTDPLLAPTHAVLLHQLHISYETEYGSQTVHIAVDGAAVSALIEVLQRALAKEATLLEQGAYTYLGKASHAR